MSFKLIFKGKLYLFLLILSVIIFQTMSIYVYAANDTIIWHIDDNGVLTIEGYGSIDYSYSQRPWSAEEMESVKEVVIKEGITELSRNLFNDFINLEKVSLPKTLISIGDVVFGSISESKKATALREITIPENVESIGAYAFANCVNLKTVNIESTKINKIPDYCFYKCNYLTDINIPESVEIIENLAFANCSSLSKIDFPYGLKTIDTNAFIYCSALEKVVIPGSVENFGEQTFSMGVNKLKEMEFENGIKFIPDGVIGYFPKIITIPDSLNSIVIKGRKDSLTLKVYGNTTLMSNTEYRKNETSSLVNMGNDAVLTNIIIEEGSNFNVDENFSTDIPIIYNNSGNTINFTIKGENVILEDKEAYPNEVLGVSLDKETIELNKGDSPFKLNAQVIPKNASNKNVTWKSSNESVVNVENGVVTPIGEGIATVTVTTNQNLYTAVCVVIVGEAKIYSINVSHKSINFGKKFEGYDTAPEAKTVIVENTGNQTVTLNKIKEANAFDIGPFTKNTLAPNEKTEFTIVPKLGLTQSDKSTNLTRYEEDIVITGTNNESAEVNVVFYVGDKPVFEIDTNEDFYEFPSLAEGYLPEKWHYITVTNSGNSLLEFSLPSLSLPHYYEFVIKGVNENSVHIKPSESIQVGIMQKRGLKHKDESYNEDVDFIFKGSYLENDEVKIYTGKKTISLSFFVSENMDYSLTMSQSIYTLKEVYEGYTEQEKIIVNLKNERTSPITLKQPVSEEFEIKNLSESLDIEALGTISFEIKPKLDLKAGVHNEDIIFIDTNGVSTKTYIMFTVKENPIYAIDTNLKNIDFGSAFYKYETLPAKETITITNTGNQTITLNQPFAENFNIGILTKTTLEPNETARFTIQPKYNLGMGSYKDELNITSDNENAKLTMYLYFYVNTFKYEYENETLTISGVGDMPVWNGISDVPWAKYIYDVKNVKILDGITSIEKNSFYCFKELENVEISDSIKRIEEDAFYGCDNLKGITINAYSDIKLIKNNEFNNVKIHEPIKIKEVKINNGNINLKAEDYEKFNTVTITNVSGKDIFVDINNENILIKNGESYPDIFYGDIDGDYGISVNDAQVLLRKVLNNDFELPIESTDIDYFKKADVDLDGALTALDASLIFQKALRNDFVFPAEM